MLVEYVKLFKQVEIPIAARKDILIEQRNSLATKMEEMIKVLDKRNYKIKVYESEILEKELVNAEGLI